MRSNFEKNILEDRIRLCRLCSSVERVPHGCWPMLSAYRSDCSCTPCAICCPKTTTERCSQLAALGYREVEAAGFFGHTPAEVKQCNGSRRPALRKRPLSSETTAAQGG